MEFLYYILRSAGILILFYLVYLFILRRDTFFTANRHFLLGGILAAVAFPFLEFTRVIYKDVAPLPPMTESFEDLAQPTTHLLSTPQEATINWWQIIAVIYIIGIAFMTIRFIKQLFSLRQILKKYPSRRLGQYTYIEVPTQSLPFSFFNYIVYNPEVHSEEELQMILKHEQIHVSQWHSVDIILANILLILQWMNPLAWMYKRGIEENLEFIADSEAAQIVPSVKQYQLALVKVSSNRPIPSITNNFYQSFTRLAVFGKKITLRKPVGQVKKRIVMLNKSTSKKSNIWKVSIVLPLLAVFLWSFNVKEVVEYREANGTLSGTTNISDISSESIAEKPSESITEIPSERNDVLNTSKTSERSDNKMNAASSVVTSSEAFGVGSKATNSEANKMIDPFASKPKDIIIEITKNTSKAELENIKTELEADGFKFNYSNLKYNGSNELTGITISYTSKEGNSGSYSVSSDDPINKIVIRSGDNGLSVRSSGSSGNSAYINQGNGDLDEEFEEQRELMRKRREEMNERRKEMREKMNEERKEVRDDMREEMKKRREEMKEEMIHVRRNSDSMRLHRGHRVDSLRNYARGSRAERDRGRSISVARSNGNRIHAKGALPKNFKKISKNSSDSDLERIKNEFEAKGVSFSYRGVKRNEMGEIVKIKLKLDNNNGSTTNSSYSGDDDEPIGTIVLSADEGTFIKNAN